MNKAPGGDPTYGCLWGESGSQAESLLESLVASRLLASSSVEDVNVVFAALFRGLWDELIPLIGPLGTEVVFARALNVANGRQALLRSVEVTESGVALDRLWTPDVGPADPATLRSALSILFLHTMEVLCSLIGIDIVESMMERITRSSVDQR